MLDSDAQRLPYGCGCGIVPRSTHPRATVSSVLGHLFVTVGARVGSARASPSSATKQIVITDRSMLGWLTVLPLGKVKHQNCHTMALSRDDRDYFTPIVNLGALQGPPSYETFSLQSVADE